jgi:hypothetical protein
MTRLRRMNADEVERILRKYGFELISQKLEFRLNEILRYIQWSTKSLALPVVYFAN